MVHIKWLTTQAIIRYRSRLIADFTSPICGSRSCVPPHTNEMEATEKRMPKTWTRTETPESRLTKCQTHETIYKDICKPTCGSSKDLEAGGKTKRHIYDRSLAARGISLEAFLIEKEREGSKIISEEKDQKKTQQLVVT